ncbi:type 1 glutamine amidotransferase domain-containing protein [Thalassotalea sp. 1_MG-2023]|uniref:type 1 glutamine amidotransferase domain-containing protein n=1 Tax=Thalassotalea sp. 1_MG-2023 TaxID=3062680 RepID=UPI0026E36028|nr:type 1 glutamine amidotransferase domain-containing protein [Thalassotalea sp. 1_MG-2023]MDO6427362.1 type 1 glutamine amidotransferase domain-containing protein [Thalassotalea sp. 1_MG-2023]
MFYRVILSILVMISFNNQALANDTIKVLIVLTSHDQLGSTGKKTGFWLPELTHPYYRLTQANIDVDIASIKGGLAPIDAKAFLESDEFHQRFLNDKTLLNKVLNTIPLETITAESYHAVLFSGGSGPMWDFPNNSDIARIATAIYHNNGIIAAVCHGVAALTNITLPSGEQLIKGKRITGFSNIEEQELGTENIVPFLLQNKLIAQGATFIEGKPWQSNVIIDGQLITGQNPASATPLADALINQLLNKQSI